MRRRRRSGDSTPLYATTLITLLPVVSLYLFGGDTLRTFALALIVGITSGAYSSIFIAAPLVIVWEEWKQRRAAKKHASAPEPKKTAPAKAR